MSKKINYNNFPDKSGHFGKYGGRFVAETLMPLIIEVEKEYIKAKKDSSFKKELSYYSVSYTHLPSPRDH